MELDDLLGATVLVGLTHHDWRGRPTGRLEQVAGRVTQAGEDGVLLVPFDDSEDRWLPPEPAAYEPAPPGQYRLKGSGQVIEDPDYLTTWTVKAPSPLDRLLLRLRRRNSA